MLFIYLVVGLVFLCIQGEENTNHVSRKLQSDKIKKPVEIIILDSDSDTDVQIEVSGISNSMLVLYLIFAFIGISL